jgi:hypothetical protein
LNRRTGRRRTEEEKEEARSKEKKEKEEVEASLISLPSPSLFPRASPWVQRRQPVGSSAAHGFNASPWVRPRQPVGSASPARGFGLASPWVRPRQPVGSASPARGFGLASASRPLRRPVPLLAHVLEATTVAAAGPTSSWFPLAGDDEVAGLSSPRARRQPAGSSPAPRRRRAPASSGRGRRSRRRMPGPPAVISEPFSLLTGKE